MCLTIWRVAHESSTNTILTICDQIWENEHSSHMQFLNF